MGAKRPSECALGGKSLASHRDRDGASEFRVKFDSSDSARARESQAQSLYAACLSALQCKPVYNKTLS